eukprot:FR740451.1.p1 GENE.FR740451.1~~FR740451.1.p1  ORF type:complete len:196 (+),score=13.66 FR740451.1:88-588(+)
MTAAEDGNNTSNNTNDAVGIQMRETDAHVSNSVDGRYSGTTAPFDDCDSADAPQPACSYLLHFGKRSRKAISRTVSYAVPNLVVLFVFLLFIYTVLLAAWWSYDVGTDDESAPAGGCFVPCSGKPAEHRGDDYGDDTNDDYAYYYGDDTNDDHDDGDSGGSGGSGD